MSVSFPECADSHILTFIFKIIAHAGLEQKTSKKNNTKHDSRRGAPCSALK